MARTAACRRDMRSHYVGAYGVFDYDQPVDPAEFAGPAGDAGPWPQDPQVPHRNQPQEDYPAVDAYQQFTGFNERVSRSDPDARYRGRRWGRADISAATNGSWRTSASG